MTTDKRTFYKGSPFLLDRGDTATVSTYRFDGDEPKCHVTIAPGHGALTPVGFIIGIEGATRLRDELSVALEAVAAQSEASR